MVNDEDDRMQLEADYESKELDSNVVSDREDGEEDEVMRTIKYPVWKPKADMLEYNWQLGTLFNTRDNYNEAITTYVVHASRALKIKTRDKVRVRVKCKEGCKWYALARKLRGEET